MTSIGPLTDAEDTWVGSEHPARRHGSGAWVRVGGSSRASLVAFALNNVLGRVVESAPFELHVGPGHIGQTYTFNRITSDWAADDVSWSGSSPKPTVGSTAVTVTVSGQTDGSVVSADLAPLLQEVADGSTWRGIQITSDAGSEQLLYATQSGQPAFSLTIELSDNPEIPEGLFPDVGAVGAAKMPLGWRAADLDGVTGQADYRIQFSTTDDGADPDEDTGWLASALPRHDMTAYSYGFTAGDRTGWRVNVRDEAGNESGWSDWAHVTYDDALGTLILDSPASTTFGDPTLRVQAHLVGEDINTFLIRVAKGDDQTAVVYNSKVQNAAGGLLDFELPFRDPKSGQQILPDDDPRWLNVRVWGEIARATGQGQPDYVEAWVFIAADDDLEVEAPSGLTVTSLAPGDPRHVYGWTLAEAPDAVLVGTGETILARLDADDYEESSGAYTYTDDGLLSPWQTNGVWVRAVYDDARSEKSNVVSVTPEIEGFWIVDSAVGAIMLKGQAVDQISAADAGTAVGAFLDGREYPVTYGPSRISGTFLGTVTSLDDLAKLETLRLTPSARPRVVWGTRSIRVRLRDLSPMPHTTFSRLRLGQAVSVGFIQVED